MSFSHVTTASGGLATGRGQDLARLCASFPLTVARRVREHRRCQRDYRYLLELPDGILEDIGLTRSQVIEAMRWRLF